MFHRFIPATALPPRCRSSAPRRRRRPRPRGTPRRSLGRPRRRRGEVRLLRRSLRRDRLQHRLSRPRGQRVHRRRGRRRRHRVRFVHPRSLLQVDRSGAAKKTRQRIALLRAELELLSAKGPREKCPLILPMTIRSLMRDGQGELHIETIMITPDKELPKR